jgi:hypothetical protein
MIDHRKKHRPVCYECNSENLTLVSAGLACLDCGFSDSRVVPTDEYQKYVKTQTTFSDVPKTIQGSRIKAGEAIRRFNAGEQVEADQAMRIKPGKGSADSIGQQYFLEPNDFRDGGSSSTLFD